jgi:hypothetical protein
VWENSKSQRDSILDQLQKVKTTLEQLRIRVDQSSKYKPVNSREGVPIEETVQIIVQGRANFTITPEMLFIEEEATKNPLKEIETLDLVLPKILTKVLYKL